MRSITTTVMDDLHDPLFPLDPSLQQQAHPSSHFFAPQPSYPAPTFTVPPSPAMDLQYILSPTILLEDQHQHQHQHQHHPPPPPLVFQEEHQLMPAPNTVQLPPQPVPSSSRSKGIPPAPPVVHRPGEHVHPNPDDAIISFDSRTRSFPRPTKPSTPSVADPYAEDFLRDMLGAERWETFSTRLFERRLGGKAKGKGKGKQGEEDDAKSGASAIEFLVKVEVVKEILRTYVPHPYNPLKSLTHPYTRAPTGQVTLTRSTVLQLSGWSNTQFSYWARRSEAVSVLAEHDSRLRAVGAALERRLRGEASHASTSNEDEGASVTGKGLDAIVDEVKKRTGKSQFLRGKHSSLDPYGSTVAEFDVQGQAPPPAQYAMPTFQAERYDHGTRRILDLEMPPSRGPRPPPVSPPAPPKRRLRPVSPSTHSQAASHDLSNSRAASSSASVPLVSPISPSDHASLLNESPSPRATRSSARKATVAPDNDAHHFPVSDSRSEVENPNAKRKPTDPDALSKKRARTSGEEEA